MSSSAKKIEDDLEQARRFYDQKTNKWVNQVLPGEIFVTGKDEFISTVLGSCVAACIRDRATKVGGINHFMLPGSAEGRRGASLRYGQAALERLINEVLKGGGMRNRLEIKIFGGGKMLAGINDVGAQNIKFVKQFFTSEQMAIEAEDLGGLYGRRLRYDPRTGKAWVKLLPNSNAEKIMEQERALQRSLKAEPVGEVELF